MHRQLMTKSISGAMLAAILVTTSVGRVAADAKDALFGAGAAVIIGCATGAINCKGKKSSGKSRSTSTRSTRPSMSAAQRQQNRDVQSALNAFGFPVGTVDGALGKRSRAAIGDYQGYMGYPATGQLTDWEREALVNSWQKFNAGAGNAYPRTMAAVGPRGLLNIERDPNFPAQFGDNVAPNYNNNNAQAGYNQGGYNQGGTWDQNQGGVVPNQPQQAFQPPQTVPVPAPVPQPQGGGQVVDGAMPKLQPLKPIGQVIVSAASRCELVDQTTRIQGGVIQAANMTDSNQALSEKFCEARGFAITQGGSVAAQFQVSENELNNLCAQVQSEFEGVVASLPTAPQAQVTAAAQSSAAQLGLTDAATTAAYGQICLGIGYRLDNAEMALSGALAMLAAGQAPYGEIVGHHLREGFGVAAAPVQAVSWYQSAIGALEQGATPVFVPSTTRERIQVIRAALQLEEQRASGGQLLPQVIPASSQLPVFAPANQ